jgi:hypothetical protein
MNAILDDLRGRRMMRVEHAERWICVRKSSHERSLFAVTREHNRMAMLLANGEGSTSKSFLRRK